MSAYVGSSKNLKDLKDLEGSVEAVADVERDARALLGVGPNPGEPTILSSENYYANALYLRVVTVIVDNIIQKQWCPG